MSEANLANLSDGDLCYLTAEQAIKGFKSRQISPVDVMKAVIAQCESVNPKLNAITYSYFDRALEQARKAEKCYSTSGKTPRPLEGVPLAIKDLHPVKDEITTWGSKIFEGVPADYSLPIVERLLDAGAILHIRTTTPEFAHTGHTHSPLWGATHNPWNLEYNSGGSSGGSAAAVAAGMTILADGDDGGGSIRIPSSACGVFGFKPPFGRNPGCLLPTNLDWILHLGPITRSVGDAILMQNVMCGPHPDDIVTLKPKLEVPQDLGDISGWKVAFSMDLGYFEVDKEVQKNTLEAIEVFRSLGCTVEEVDVGWDNGAYDAWITHWEGLFASVAGQHIPRWQYEMDPFVRQMLQRGMNHSYTRVKQTEFVRAEMYKKLSPIMQEYQILLCPTTAVPSVPLWNRCDNPDFKINGKPVDAMIQWCMTYPFNLLSQCPVASVPSGFAKSGVPTGLQIVGRTYDDVSVFQAAKAYEAANPWLGIRPNL
ncbi:Aspartyl-tRNA(Asn) amidotransferase subunit A @ Glutamyl-tRNA(Gln) amidotransferase subunit A [hydrothermal vent metagenome]|uniref:Aspartyl-tRNA(Asn) amidotransferase subunit A @ Glutamyl-tRNA(Gln) amidotransferase subunit A n=1 Tax=hydrothermal vent metagenome TaxID=652676 RepID=A0A3B0S179_9ZZZZ